MSKVYNALAFVDGILAEARQAEKQASLKQAADPHTSHPVGKADNGTVPVNEGERSRENSAYVRDRFGSRANSGQSDANEATSRKPIDDIGTVKQRSDEVKGNVKDPKGDKDLPSESTGHPSNAECKYSEIRKACMSLVDELTSKLASDSTTTPVTTPATTTPATPATSEATTEVTQSKEAELEKEANLKIAAAKEHPDDAAAGYMAAEALLTQLSGQTKASEEYVKGTLETIIKSAQSDAQMFADYFNGHMAGLQELYKSANEIPPELAAAMGGGGGEGQDPSAGGPPMDPSAGGPPGGGGEDEAVLERLVEALDAAGVTPEELAQALAEIESEHGGQGGEGGGAGEAGVDPMAAMAAAGGGGPPPEIKGASEKEAEVRKLIKETLRKATK